MSAERKRTFFHSNNTAVLKLFPEELFHHTERLSSSDDHGVRILVHKNVNTCGMIRFHMLYDQVIRRLSGERFFQIFQPGIGKACVYRIKYCRFFIADHIGIVGHAVWHIVLSLEQVNVIIVYAEIFNVICDKHSLSDPLSFSHLKTISILTQEEGIGYRVL